MNKEITKEAGKLIASFLKNRREEMGLSAEDLAALCNVTRSTIWRIEQGKFLPKLELLLVMTHHLNCYFFLEAKDGEGEAAKMMRERWGKMSKN